MSEKRYFWAGHVACMSRKFAEKMKQMRPALLDIINPPPEEEPVPRLKYRVRIMRIYACNECPNLNTLNVCDELCEMIEDPNGEIPVNCPLEERWEE